LHTRPGYREGLIEVIRKRIGADERAFDASRPKLPRTVETADAALAHLAEQNMIA
jgi:hypothetical protein